MIPRARHVTTIELPTPDAEHTVTVQHWPTGALLLVRADDHLCVYDIDTVLRREMEPVTFPAPWPRRVGSATASPDLTRPATSRPGRAGSAA